MARKDRAPNPPKRPQGPQRRSTPTDPAAAARRRRLLLLGAVASVAAVALALALVFLTRGGDEDVSAVFEEAGCTFEAVPAVSGDHTAKIDATSDPKWNTNPPTSGPHYDVPAVYGSYDEPLQLAQVVHNLEHGAIFVLYGPGVSAPVVEQLQAFYDDDPRGLLLAPLPSLKAKIALGAWTTSGEGGPDAKGTAYLATCTSFEEEAFERFRDEYRFRGPERFPPESLQPGST